ncbi:hypothetical protein TNCV_3350371 [Trichonephila clavipes]|nr:hypothetical protein TNCV_3350371 [Trichonephila clavipes]
MQPQRFIEEVTRGLPGIYAFVDDILIASKNPQEHYQHLKNLFSKLDEYGLCINVSKCIFGASTIDFLGFNLSENGIKPLNDKFLEGHTNQKKPHSSVRKSSKPLKWNENAEQGFLAAENAIAKATLLRHPIPGAQLSLWVDTSGIAIGGTLSQLSQGKWETNCLFLHETYQNHIHIDIVSPLPPSEGHHYLLTIIDRFSRWPEAISIPGMQVKTICRAIFDTWISRFGCPSVITSDQGIQMRSSMYAEFTRILGTEKIKTVTYPKSNGIVERFHRHLKSAIKAHENDTWSEIVPIILLGMRTAVKEDLQSSSHIFLRIDRVQSPLRQPYTGPHKVLSRTDKTTTIDVNGRKTTVSLDRVKPSQLLSETVCESVPTVIESVEEGERKVDVAKTFEIPLSSLSSILKNKEKIFSVYSSRVRKRASKVLIMIDKSWRAVTPLKIHSCFKKSGFLSPNLVDVDETLTEFNTEPSLWEALPELDLTFDDYVLVDTDIAVC